MTKKNTDKNILLIPNNSLTCKVKECLFDAQNLVDNSDSSNYPPDFYSDVHQIAFDMYEINDSENKKGKNKIKQRENDMIKEIKQYFPHINSENIFTNSIDYKNYYKEHNYNQYYNHLKRVTKKHIPKIEKVWKLKNKQNFKNGFFILDITELYFSNDDRIIHYPWKDEKFIELFLRDGVDFIVWYFPYKNPDNIRNVDFPYGLVIIDLKNFNHQLIDYSQDELVSA